MDRNIGGISIDCFVNGKNYDVYRIDNRVERARETLILIERRKMLKQLKAARVVEKKYNNWNESDNCDWIVNLGDYFRCVIQIFRLYSIQ